MPEVPPWGFRVFVRPRRGPWPSPSRRAVSRSCTPINVAECTPFRSCWTVGPIVCVLRDCLARTMLCAICGGGRFSTGDIFSSCRRRLFALFGSSGSSVGGAASTAGHEAVFCGPERDSRHVSVRGTGSSQAWRSSGSLVVTRSSMRQL
jgi:hypothetical protein